MKKLILIILFIIISLQLNGCGKYDIDQLTTATAIGIDKNEDGLFQVSAQVLNANAMGNNPRDVTPVVVVTETGRTVQEALRKMTNFFTNKLFFSHFQILFIGEDLAREGVEPYLNFFSINVESQHAFEIVIVKDDKAETALKILTMLTIIPAIAIEGKLRASLRAYGISRVIYMDEVISDIRTEGVELALGSIMIEGDADKGSESDHTKNPVAEAILKASTIGVFKKDKLVGWLTERESLGFNYIKGNISSSFIIVVKKDGILVSTEIENATSKVTVKLENEQIVVTIDVKLTATVTEDLSGSTSYELEYAKDIEKRISFEVKTMIEESITKAIEFNSDIFCFGKYIHRFNPKGWATIRDRYDEIYPDLKAEINVSTTVSRVLP